MKQAWRISAGVLIFCAFNSGCGTQIIALSGTSTSSSSISLTPPSSLLALATSGAIRLTWNASSGPAPIIYHVNRSTTSSSGYVEIATTSSVAYVDSTVTAEIPYYYTVVASSGSTQSTLTAEAVKTTYFIADTFPDSTPDSNYWSQWFSGGGDLQASTASGVLGITPPANTAPNGGFTNTYAGLNGVFFNFTDRQVILEVTSRLTTTESTEGRFAIQINGNNRLNVLFFGSTFCVSKVVASTETYLTGCVAYNPTTQKFLRIGHKTAGNLVTVYGSPDGVIWTSIVSTAAPFAMTNIQLSLGAGIYATSTNPGTASFDNVVVRTNP